MAQRRAICMRTGCPVPATAVLAFAWRRRQAWLRSAADARSAGWMALCTAHAASASVPKGWTLHDQRVIAPVAGAPAVNRYAELYAQLPALAAAHVATRSGGGELPGQLSLLDASGDVSDLATAGTAPVSGEQVTAPSAPAGVVIPFTRVRRARRARQPALALRLDPAEDAEETVQ